MIMMVQDVFWTSYVRLIYVLRLLGKYVRKVNGKSKSLNVS